MDVLQHPRQLLFRTGVGFQIVYNLSSVKYEYAKKPAVPFQHLGLDVRTATVLESQ